MIAAKTVGDSHKPQYSRVIGSSFCPVKGIEQAERIVASSRQLVTRIKNLKFFLGMVKLTSMIS